MTILYSIEEMNKRSNIIDCYNKTAGNYAGRFIDELSKKHLDRILLQAFARKNGGKGKIIDLGCGPGQTTRYLAGCGITDIIGTDLSPGMIDVAKKINPQLAFETADMLSLPYDRHSFGSAIAFYAIVHFYYSELETAFGEVKRVLKSGGEFLFSFHIGDNTVHLDQFLDHDVNIDFHFFETSRVLELLDKTGFEIIDSIERQPYKDVEYPSQRAYLWVRNP
jgi:SAM-dependent methyltransferase